MSLNCQIIGCTNIAERNGICATHNHQARRAEKEANKPRKVYTMPKVSEKKKQANAQKAAAYKKMDATEAHFCSGCGGAEMLTHSHLIPVSQHPEFEAEPLNIVYDCIKCHDIWEHGKLGELAQNLANYEERMQRIKQLSPQYLARMLANRLK